MAAMLLCVTGPPVPSSMSRANGNQPFITSTHFTREADASKFKPTPCES